MAKELNERQVAERESIKAEFQSLVTADQEFSPEKAALAFALSQRYTSAGGFKGNFHASVVIDALLYGERPDPTTASLGNMELRLNTEGFAGNKSGGLLEGLAGDDLKKAEDFLSKTSKAYDALFTR